MAKKPNRTVTRLLLLTGTILITFFPLYLTAWHDAVYDGAFLLIAVAFLTDSLFRCIDPASWKGNRNVFFIVTAFLMLVMALLQYGPIASELHDEKQALQQALEAKSIQQLAQFESERAKKERQLPNSSVALLLASVMLEYSVILFVED
jgi:hypothetical protein